MPRSSEGGGYPHPTNSGQDTKQIPRSSEGGDEPHPYIGCVLQISYYQLFVEKLGMVSGFCHFPSRMSESALCSGVAHEQGAISSEQGAVSKEGEFRS